MIFNDVKNLKKEHLVQADNGEWWIRKAREKTDNMCDIPLLDIPKLILEKYQSNPICNEKGLLLPENKWFTNLCSVGNVGSASIFIMLSELFHSSKLKKGELIYLFIPESGRFSYTTALLKVE